MGRLIAKILAWLAILLGLALFLVLGLFLRDLSRVQKNRWLMAAAAMGLLGITLVIGNSKYGAVNWISIGGMSFQPSEICKLAIIISLARQISRHDGPIVKLRDFLPVLLNFAIPFALVVDRKSVV